MEIENNIQNEASEGATPNEPETQQDNQEGNATDTAPQGQDAATDDSTRDGGEGAESAGNNEQAEPFLTFKFNHEERALNRDEAIDAAQRGLKYGEVSEKLDRIAAIKGQSVSELIDGMISAERETYRNGLIERLGDDGETVERLMKLYDIEQGEKYSKAVSDREAEAKQQEESLNARLAAEFITLKKEFPEFAGYGDLPAEVRTAAEDGKDLMTAYLLHKHRTEKAAAAAKEAAENAAKASIGSMSGENENTSSEEQSFLKGLWG